MKNANFKIAAILAACVSLSSCTSCEDDHDHIPRTTVSGNVMISHNPVENGETVYLSIDSIPGENTTSNRLWIINNYCLECEKSFTWDATPSVHYYIDGIDVGNSDALAKSFKCEYIVNLKEGTHTLSAKPFARPQKDNNDTIIYEGEYKSTEFTVIGSQK